MSFFIGIDRDFVNTTHGTTEYCKQIIRHHILYRDAIIQHSSETYPMDLFMFNEELLNRKQMKTHNSIEVNQCFLPNPVPKEKYDASNDDIVKCVQVHFKDQISFYYSLIVSGVLIKTILVSYGKLTNDSCISFYFSDKQIRYGLIRAIVKSKQDAVRLYIEELVEKKPASSKIKFKVNDKEYQLPNVFLLQRSKIFHIKHPRCFVKKHAIICKPGNYVTVLEYPNLKDNS